MEQEPNMQGRREASRATKMRRRKARLNALLLIGILAAVIILVLVTPKEPIRRATYSNATESGMVEETGTEVLGAYSGLVISEIMPSNATAVTDEQRRPDTLPVPGYQPGTGRPNHCFLRQYQPVQRQPRLPRQVQDEQRRRIHLSL